jgi:cysteinyl-tRNA synthetase, unknown class
MKLPLLSILLVQFLAIGDSVSAQQPPPASFAYVLQADSLAKSKAGAVARLATCDRDWIVLDASFSSDEPWTAADLAAIRAGRAGRKVIAYLSIGEAEDYRAYWQSSWRTNAPAFLLTENPEWKGNYRVKYWQAGWQRLILADVDKIMAAGFDGVYLDIVDGFETFEQDGNNFDDDRLNPETKQSYRRDMVDWVKAVAARARRMNPAALVIPQNGSQLLAHADFLGAVDAVGVEDFSPTATSFRSPPIQNTFWIFCHGCPPRTSPSSTSSMPGARNARRRLVNWPHNTVSSGW